jgi:uncharacterized membrane protein YagU involved in acid resistance
MLNQCLATYRGHRFPKEIISHSVWLYFRFAVSFAMWKNYWPRVAFWSAMQRCGAGAKSSGSFQLFQRSAGDL